MKYFLYLLIIVSFFFSCKTERKERRIKVNETVDYREVLFGVDDSLPLVEIDTRLSANQVGSEIEHFLKRDICGEKINFNISIKGERFNNFFIQKYCGGTIGCVFPRAYNEILVNRKGMAMLERKSVDIQEIDSLFMNSYFKEKDKGNFFTIIDFQSYQEKISEDSLIKVLKQVRRGYLLIYDSLSRESFDKKVDQLNIKELGSLRKMLPYNIQLGRTYSLPPPPPAPENY